MACDTPTIRPACAATSQSSRAGASDLSSAPPTARSIRAAASGARPQRRGSNDLRCCASRISRATIPGRSCGVAGRIEGGMIGLRGRMRSGRVGAARTPTRSRRAHAVVIPELWERSKAVSAKRKTAPRLLAARLFETPRYQAARTFCRNASTSPLSTLPSRDSDFAEESTWLEAEPVSFAALLTSPMLLATCGGALRGAVHVARNLLRGRALLLDRRRDRRGDLRDAADGAADLLDGARPTPRSRSACRRSACRSRRSPSRSATRAPSPRKRPPRSRGRLRRRAPPRSWR